jgi:cobalt/nickel transport system permease protein
MADGGITALGTNITLVGLVGVLVGWFVFKTVLALLPRRLSSVPPAAAIGALVSVPAAAVVFTALFAVGGQAPVSTSAVLVAMLGWHSLIGIGEAVVTALVVGAVVKARPDLVYGARGLLEERELEIRTAPVRDAA